MNIHYNLSHVSFIIVIMGALNWGLVGLFGIDLVARLFGPGSKGAKAIYTLIGLAAVILLLE